MKFKPGDRVRLTATVSQVYDDVVHLGINGHNVMLLEGSTQHLELIEREQVTATSYPRDEPKADPIEKIKQNLRLNEFVKNLEEKKCEHEWAEVTHSSGELMTFCTKCQFCFFGQLKTKPNNGEPCTMCGCDYPGPINEPSSSLSPPKPKVTRWKWAWQGHADKDWYESPIFWTEEEFYKHHQGHRGYESMVRRLDYTKQEFDE